MSRSRSSFRAFGFFVAVIVGLLMIIIIPVRREAEVLAHVVKQLGIAESAADSLVAGHAENGEWPLETGGHGEARIEVVEAGLVRLTFQRPEVIAGASINLRSFVSENGYLRSCTANGIEDKLLPKRCKRGAAAYRPPPSSEPPPNQRDAEFQQ